jgi:outer membrane protein TolC
MASDKWISADCHDAGAGKAGCIAARQEVTGPLRLIGALCLVFFCGCQATRVDVRANRIEASPKSLNDRAGADPRIDEASDSKTAVVTSRPVEREQAIEQVSGVAVDKPLPQEVADNPSPAADEELPSPRADGPTQPIVLEQVVDAIYQSYPLLRIAIAGRDVALGDNVAAQGEFDLKLKGDTLNQPRGYYQTYRQGVGFDQPLYGGGSVFGAYRIGQGNFEPWYGNRETNGGGEFQLGLSVPLWQNRAVDERRAQLWRTEYGQSLVEPEIRSQLLEFVRDGSIAYWEWVAAGQNFRYAEQLVKLAQDRDQQLRSQVEEGDRAESDLTDNERLIVGRRVKRLATLQKLQTTAVKLSLYLRMPGGIPFVPGPELLPGGFPVPSPIERNALEQDIQFAQARRPELMAFDITRRQLDVDLQQANNLLQPTLDGQMLNSKDVGSPTPKGDKTPYQLEAGLLFSVPLQRRKAKGKLAAVEGKIAQLQAKRQFASDKISVEVQAAVIALDMAYQAIGQAREAIRLNEEMQRFETIKLEKGDSDFLRLNLRETATFDARVIEIESLLRYFEAQSEYRAAIAVDLPDVIEMAP